MNIKSIFVAALLATSFFTAHAQSTNDWKLVWSDEFNVDGAPNPANWDYERGFVRNEELQWYQPENAICTNGLLVIEGRPEHKRNPDYVAGSKDWRKNREWIDYTSSSLITLKQHEFTYGKFEMRARIDTQLGSWPAFWTLGADREQVRWPACGEIDIMEFYTHRVLANFGCLMDGKMKWSAIKKPVAELGGDAWSKAFHIWTMEWDAKKIDLFLDGKLMNSLVLADLDKNHTGDPFHKPLYLILNQAVGATGGDVTNTKFPIRFEVDWVRAYQR